MNIRQSFFQRTAALLGRAASRARERAEEAALPPPSAETGLPPRAGHELSDAHFSPVFKAALAIVIVVLLSMGAVALLLQAFSRHPQVAERALSPLAPRESLSVKPPSILSGAALKKMTDPSLESYGWISRDSGIVRIPIERAMALLVQERLPVQEQMPVREQTPVQMPVQEHGPVQAARAGADADAAGLERGLRE